MTAGKTGAVESIPREVGGRIEINLPLTPLSPKGTHHEPLPRRRNGRLLLQLALTSFPVVMVDLACLCASVCLASYAVGLVWPTTGMSLLPLVTLLCVAQMSTYVLFGLYPVITTNPIVEIRQISLATLIVFSVFLAATVIQQDGGILTEGIVLAACLQCLIAIPFARALTRSVYSRAEWWGHPILIFGGGAQGISLYKSLKANPSLGFKPVGIVDDLESLEYAEEPPAYLGSPARATWLADELGVYWAVMALPDGCGSQMQRTIETYGANIPHFIVVPDMTGFPSLWNYAHDCGGMPGIQVKQRLLLAGPRFAKRALDLTFTLFGGLLILPLLGLIALLIKLSSPGPIFYCQERIGLNARRFWAWKFRTMVPHADAVLRDYLAAHPEYREEWEQFHKLKNDPRVTGIGSLLRRTSLDELPQIWNVLCGEMSLVGPRPIVQDEIAKYAEKFEIYTKVIPGITGLWQISGRNDTTYQERVDLDTFYVRNWSPWLDFYILAHTVRVVVGGHGAY